MREVHIYPDRVEKTATLESEVVEMAAKYKAVWEVSRLGDVFRAPRLLDVSVADKKIVLERLFDIEGVVDLYLGAQHGGAWRDVLPVFRKIGGVLALLHNNLRMPRAVQWSASPCFEKRLSAYLGRPAAVQSAPQAFLHCDYSFANVYLEAGTRKIAILDPCTNHRFTDHDWQYGPIYLDIGKFLACLEGQVPMRSYFGLDRRRCAEMQIAFIAGYEEGSRLTFDRSLAFAFGYAVAAMLFTNRSKMTADIRLAALYNKYWQHNYPYAVKEALLAE